MANEVPAVAAAVRILDRLAASAPAAVSPGQLVNELGLNRSTCYNILATLQRAGWAQSMGERAGWTLGPRLLIIGSRTDELVVAIVQQELEDLSTELGFVAFLAERDGTGAYVVVAKAERQTGVRVTVGVGDTFPFSAPALMQAFAAWMPVDDFDRLVDQHGLVQFTDRTIVDREELRNVLDRVRKDGFSRSIRQFNHAQGAVAAPVFDGKGRAVRAVCVLAFSSQLDENNAVAVGKAVRACAEEITQRTGGIKPLSA